MISQQKMIRVLALLGTLLLLPILSSVPLFSKIYGSVSGQVIGEDTGKGVKGVMVFLYFYYEKSKRFGDYPYAAETDERGRFQIKNLEPGRYCMTVSAPPPYYGDHDYLHEKLLLKGNSEGADCFILRSGERKVIKKVIKVGGSVSGRVLKGDGSPFAGLEVWVGSRRGNEREAITGEDGRFHIGGLKPSDDYLFVLRSFKHNDAVVTGKTIENLIVREKEETKIEDIVVDVNDPTGIEGIVKLSDGTAIEGALVGIIKGRRIVSDCHTDKNGRFKIINVEPGIYTIGAAIVGKDIFKENIYIEKGKTLWVEFVFDSKKSNLKKNLNNSYEICSQNLLTKNTSESSNQTHGKTIEWHDWCIKYYPLAPRIEMEKKVDAVLNTVKKRVNMGGLR